jgi:hypothetical protein
LSDEGGVELGELGIGRKLRDRVEDSIECGPRRHSRKGSRANPMLGALQVGSGPVDRRDQIAVALIGEAFFGKCRAPQRTTRIPRIRWGERASKARTGARRDA